MRFYLASLLIFIAVLSGARAAGTSGGCETGQTGAGATTGGHMPSSAYSRADRLAPLPVAFFLDPTGEIGPEDIARRNFMPGPCNGVFAAPLPGQVLWFRFQVANSDESALRRAISFQEAILDEVVLFAREGDGMVAVARNGRTVPVSARASDALKLSLPLTLAPGDEQSFYLRIKGALAPTITPAIVSPAFLADWSSASTIMSAVLLAFLFVLLLLSLIVFRKIQARFYRYYALFVGCQFLFTLHWGGWLSVIPGVMLPVSVMARVSEGLAGSAVLANILYCGVLLNIDSDPPRQKWVFMPLTGAALIAAALAIVNPWTLATPIHLIYVIAPMVLLAVSILKIREGLPQAKPVCGSLLCLIVGLFIATTAFYWPADFSDTTSVFHTLPIRPMEWGYNIAIIGEAIFMMIAISVLVAVELSEKQAAIIEANSLQHDLNIVRRQHAEALRLTAASAESSTKDLPPSVEHHLVERASECVLNNIAEEGFGARQLAAALGVSEKTLGRRLKVTGHLTPAAFIRAIRLEFARDLILRRQHDTVAQIAHATGFSSTSHFAKMFRQEFSEAPSDLLKLSEP
ncbi:MAG: helix-turn-helix domain-containing protein [Alphaproteobacteria bacterium]|nr:helix-turn-helix domain-containing protein [Alphaproteobacteria bacterium]